jgi:hypothetical protein
MELFSNLWFSLGIVSIMAVVAFIYYLRGRSDGIQDVLKTFHELEPDAYNRAINRLRAKVNNE